jgi:peptidyl-prolyl cis-trans isomerase A (cyclophilin A)
MNRKASFNSCPSLHPRWYLLLLLSAACFVNGCREEQKSQMEDAKMTNTVKLQTSMGDIVIELNRKAAPVTVQNFIDYVQADFYNGAIFHRVINGFMIQGGGFGDDMRRKETQSPIVNEASNGLKNDRGTIAMARTNNPDSATSQFFINLADNNNLDYSANNPGYTVFGEVTDGMEVVDAIAKVKTTTRSGMSDVPAEPVEIQAATISE